MIRLVLSLSCLLFIACSEPAPVKIGFIGSLTGPTADLGSRARNGSILAIEQWNQRGGLAGQPIELLIKDDKNDPIRAVAMANELVLAQAMAIVGPSTSTMALSVVPIINQAKLPTFGTTVTTDDLVDIDDYFFRPVASTRASTRHLSEFITRTADIKGYAIITDLSNEAYTRSWKMKFNHWMQQADVPVSFEQDFVSGDNLALLEISQQLALLETDMIVLVTNARDAALLIKQIRSINTTALIVTCEWAGTTDLLRLAGVDAEGVIVPRYIDENSEDTRYKTLASNYGNRFQQDMGYAGFLAYNSTNALLDAIANKSKQQTIKEYLLGKKHFDGVLTNFELNAYGDEISNAFHFITDVRQGQFMTRRD